MYISVTRNQCETDPHYVNFDWPKIKIKPDFGQDIPTAGVKSNLIGGNLPIFHQLSGARKVMGIGMGSQ